MVVSSRPRIGRILEQIYVPLLLFFLISVIVVVLNGTSHRFRSIAIPDLTLSVLAAALGILLGFRTNSAYSRWWEARTLWGALVNSSRSLARQALSFPNGGGVGLKQEEARQFAISLIYQQMAFVHALRCALRRQAPWPEIQSFLPASTVEILQTQQNVPAALLIVMGEQSATAAENGILNEWRLQRIDSTLTDLSNIMGGCERIKNTPLPRQYDTYPELFVWAYCVLLPIVLVEEMQLMTPFIIVIMSCVFLILNRIGKNLEDPFENKVYDVPLTALSRTIEINLRQMLGESNLPPAIVPVDGILW
jgi:ion channel-forming bestrophin family protein